MPLALTLRDLRAHLNRYLNLVSDNDDVVTIVRSRHRAVTIIPHEKLEWLEIVLRAKQDSLDYAIARDQLIKHGVLPDDPIVESNDDYWNQFVNHNN